MIMNNLCLMGQKEKWLEGINTEVMRNGPQLNKDQIDLLIAPVTDKEIKMALDGIGDNKSPGIDGYDVKFFKVAWHILNKEVCAVVKEFFLCSRIYKELNCTLVTLNPKVDGAKTLKDYISISCCNTIYKVISKILTSR